MRELHEWVTTEPANLTLQWPLPPADFAAALGALLHAKPSLSSFVGYRDHNRTDVAWIKVCVLRGV